MARAPISFRTCRRCAEVFPKDQVYTSFHCKTCEPLRRKEYLDANPDKRAAANASASAYSREHRADKTAKARERYQRKRTERSAEHHARGLYTVREVATMLNRSYDMFRHQVARGLLVTIREEGHVYVHADAIEAYRREHLQPRQPDRPEAASSEYSDAALQSVRGRTRRNVRK